MDINLHNTLSGRIDTFVPANPRQVSMYVCGPTVYGPVHVGNARPAVVFDLFYRLLRRRYEKTLYARNITDIDDKIIAAAAAENISPPDLAARWKDAYHRDMKALGVLSPDIEPAATAYIGNITVMIETLLAKGNAYYASEHVLFDLTSFADYGALSNRRQEDMMEGARVEVADYKRNGGDFVLWKPSLPEQPGWPSPWGRGRPGWHIECSAMAAACLGEEIDIHGGGQDLIFPHHENEIAQSRCAHGKAHFARYWLHNGHVDWEGEKMSKSLGNVRLLKDALARFPGEAVRYALLSAHYRSPLRWSEDLMHDAKAALDSLYRAAQKIGDVPATAPAPAVEECLCDDMNTPAAFAVLHTAAAKIRRGGDKQAPQTLMAVCTNDGVFEPTAGKMVSSSIAKNRYLKSGRNRSHDKK